MQPYPVFNFLTNLFLSPKIIRVCTNLENNVTKDFEAAVSENIPPKSLSPDELDAAYIEADKLSPDAKLDLRKEVFSQIKLLEQVRRHLFSPEGTLKDKTEFKDIRSYLSSSTQLLTMLQKFEEAMNTDRDFQKVEEALEKAMEEAPCPEFVALFKKYLLGEDSEG